MGDREGKRERKKTPASLACAVPSLARSLRKAVSTYAYVLELSGEIFKVLQYPGVPGPAAGFQASSTGIDGWWMGPEKVL